MVPLVRHRLGGDASSTAACPVVAVEAVHLEAVEVRRRVGLRARTAGRASAVSAGFASRSVFTAVRTNTWSPQTTGVALPRPTSRSAFQLMFVCLVPLGRRVGGAGAKPLASGPRQLGQLSAAAALVANAKARRRPGHRSTPAERA